MTVSSFERSISVSNGYVRNISKSIQPDILERIYNEYSYLNIEWLLIGKGGMFKERSSTSDISFRIRELLPAIGLNVNDLLDKDYANALNKIGYESDWGNYAISIANKIVEIYPQVNLEWIIDGKNEMIKSVNKGGKDKCNENNMNSHVNSVSLPKDVWEVIELQSQTIRSQQITIERYSKMIESIRNDKEK